MLASLPPHLTARAEHCGKLCIMKATTKTQKLRNVAHQMAQQKTATCFQRMVVRQSFYCR